MTIRIWHRAALALGVLGVAIAFLLARGREDSSGEDNPNPNDAAVDQGARQMVAAGR